MKYLLALILLLSINICNAQEINGIGVIKLGKTTTQIINDLKIDSTDIIDGATKTMKELVKKCSKSYVKIKFDPASILTKDILSKSKYFDHALHELGIEKCQDAVLLIIPKYEVAGVTIDYLKLTFCKDTLIRILYRNATDRNKNFLVAFKVKYGEGESKEFKSSSSFITTINWKSNVPNVIVRSMEASYGDTDSDGLEIPFGGGGTGLGPTFSFQIQNNQYIHYLDDCEKKGANTNKNNGL